jgi:hypothetical protein
MTNRLVDGFTPPAESTAESSSLTWRFQAAESDNDSDTDVKPSTGTICTPPMSHTAPFQMVKGTPTQSEGTTMTSWDEWDGPEHMLCQMDPIMVTERVKSQYHSLL